MVVGVPVIVPKLVLRAKPTGSAGDIEYPVAVAPPKVVGPNPPKKAFLVYEYGDDVYENTGGLVLTVVVTTSRPNPEALVALISNETDPAAVVGVPEITPSLALRDRPAGSVPELRVQLVEAPPVLVGVIVTAVP